MLSAGTDEVGTGIHDIEQAAYNLEQLGKKKGKTGSRVWDDTSRTVAEHLTDTLMPDMRENEIRKRVADIYRLIDKGGKDNLREAHRMALDLTESMLMGQVEYTDEAFGDVVSYLKRAPVYMDESERAEIKRTYGSMTEYRRQTGNLIRTTNADNGRTLDGMWAELHDMNPSVFAEDEVNKADTIVNYIETNRGRSLPTEYERVAANEAMNIVAQYINAKAEYVSHLCFFAVDAVMLSNVPTYCILQRAKTADPNIE